MMGVNSTVIGVVLMSFGAAPKPEDVPAYLASVRGGHPAPSSLVAEFQRRYRLIGRSPLNHITREQAAALESLLNQESREGRRYRVVVGMRHASPWISEALAQLDAEGARQVVAIILSPHYSPIIMGGYHRALDEAKPSLNPATIVRVAGAWYMLPSFLDSLARRVCEALHRFPPRERETVPVLMTAHSLPRRVVEEDPEYIPQLQRTAVALAERVGLSPTRWQFAYQSAGHTPEEWLNPDLKELFPALRKKGTRAVLIVPLQFLADHLEILYDIDIAARDEAEAAGLEMARIESLNTMPQFIRSLAEVVYQELAP
ncbi:MAG: ferrochelatase [Chloroflexi bacterium]|nr:ferrochelatase [Chloroflexota bacterium]